MWREEDSVSDDYYETDLHDDREPAGPPLICLNAECRETRYAEVTEEYQGIPEMGAVVGFIDDDYRCEYCGSEMVEEEDLDGTVEVVYGLLDQIEATSEELQRLLKYSELEEIANSKRHWLAKQVEALDQRRGWALEQMKGPSRSSTKEAT